MPRPLEKLKKMVFNGVLLEDSIDQLENDGVPVRDKNKTISRVVIQENDFSPKVVHEGKKMSSVYIAFFCIENSVRDLIQERLSERSGIDWWKESVPEKIRKSVDSLKKKEEKDKYISPRSSRMLGYTTFGELGQIIVSNWEKFSDIIPDQHWLSSRLADLEKSRNVIMHTGVLPDEEIERIERISNDWVNQVS